MKFDRKLLLIWVAWAALLLAYQAFVGMRYAPQRPDYAVFWTPSETRANSQDDQPYLIVPFMNAQVSWDSEFYLSIAYHGYDDPSLRTVQTELGNLSLNYAFFPFYPMLMRVLSYPLHYLLGLPWLEALTLAGVILSLLGTLAAMIALYDLGHSLLGEEGGLRAASYLLIFPTSFFLAQVYTEGLFVGLAFGALALAARRRFVWAALLACFATWTRAVGVALILPLALMWWQGFDLAALKARPLDGRALAGGLLALAPLLAFGLWWLLLGRQFGAVEDAFFSRGALVIGRSLSAWSGSLSLAFNGESPQSAAYYSLELLLIGLALAGCALAARDWPGVALFSVALIAISLFSGGSQSMGRYVMAAPAIYLAAAKLGRAPAFDRAWVYGGVLLQAMLAALFTFDMWVA